MLLVSLLRACLQARTSVVKRAASTILSTEHLTVMMEPVNMFQMNQYLICCHASGESAAVDAGDPARLWVDECAAQKTTISNLLLTHAHIDHILGLKAASEKWAGAPIWLHDDDQEIYDGVAQFGAMFGVDCETPPPPSRVFIDGAEVNVGSLCFKILHTPGHSPGSVILHERTHGFAFVGDLIFRGSIGRTDLPGCDPHQMQQSLARACKDLPDETVLLPGHMDITTLGEEKRSNPFLQ